jgi:hypothetical protein
MGVDQSKGSIRYYEHVIHDTANALRRDPGSMDQEVAERRTITLRAFHEMCTQEDAAIWENPHVDKRRLAKDCNELRKAIEQSKTLQDAFLDYHY